jgi:aspartyl/asparaginyl beta-hydroxylase (cupin superfamily)
VRHDGDDLVFDETFIHRAENMTDQNRIILFCDVERSMKNKFMTKLNRWASHNVVKGSATQNVEGERVGAINKAFSYLYEIHLVDVASRAGTAASIIRSDIRLRRYWCCWFSRQRFAEAAETTASGAGCS